MKYTFIVKIPQVVTVEAENEDAAMAAIKLSRSQPYEIIPVIEEEIKNDAE